MKIRICQKEAKELQFQFHPFFRPRYSPQQQTTPLSRYSHGPIQYLSWVRVFHVRLCTVRNAALQHLLHAGHQEDLHMWVSHRENTLQQIDSSLSDSGTPYSHHWVWPSCLTSLATVHTDPAMAAAIDGPQGLTRCENSQLLKNSSWYFAYSYQQGQNGDQLATLNKTWQNPTAPEKSWLLLFHLIDLFSFQQMKWEKYGQLRWLTAVSGKQSFQVVFKPWLAQQSMAIHSDSSRALAHTMDKNTPQCYWTATTSIETQNERPKSVLHPFYVAQARLGNSMHKVLAWWTSLGVLCPRCGGIQQHITNRWRVQVHVEVSWNLAIILQVK